MPSPQQLPIRILVKGASNVGLTSPMGGSRENMTFPRVVEMELLHSGRPATVQAITVPSERTKSSLARWEREMMGFSPDVVVLVFGYYETIHLFLPWWLERHANSLRKKQRRVSRLYRKLLLRPFWMVLAKTQSRVDALIDPTIRRGRPRRVAADLESLIEQIRSLQNPLVYCFELLPPASRYESWFPGMSARVGVMNDAIESLVKRIDSPDVRYLRVAELVDEVADGDLNEAVPDGFHYSAAMHRRIGEVLARDIAVWADRQPHLSLPS